jgi:hypothetical protein
VEGDCCCGGGGRWAEMMKRRVQGEEGTTDREACWFALGIEVVVRRDVDVGRVSIRRALFEHTCSRLRM